MVDRHPSKGRRKKACSKKIRLNLSLDISEEAQADVLDIVQWLDARSEEAGDRFLADSAACFDRLLRLPNTGRRYETGQGRDLGFRYGRVSARFHDYLVFYFVRSQRLRIVAITHGSRDLELLLRDR